MRKTLVVIASLILTSACSKEDSRSEMSSILECSMSAKLVGQTHRIDTITNHANKLSIRLGFSESELFDEVSKMHAAIKAKWNLKSMSRADQDKLLVSIYNSPYCAKLHGGPSITVEDVPADS